MCYVPIMPYIQFEFNYNSNVALKIQVQKCIKLTLP
jgi:hypothetical protein